MQGTTLFWPLTRQVLAEETAKIDKVHDLLSTLTIFSLVLILPVISAGSLLPTWMFINALQILAHMVLLKTLMPGNAHYFLKKYLDWLRWYDRGFIDYMQQTYDFRHSKLNEGAYNRILQVCDYEAFLAQNLLPVLVFLLIILVVWIVLSLRDCVLSKKRLKNRPKAPWCHNFTVRFIYEFFLEFCICSTLQLTIRDFSYVSPTLQFLLAVVVSIATVALIAFVTSLFFRNGPWVSTYY